jgi:hypothetical protein
LIWSARFIVQLACKTGNEIAFAPHWIWRGIERLPSLQRKPVSAGQFGAYPRGNLDFIAIDASLLRVISD